MLSVGLTLLAWSTPVSFEGGAVFDRLVREGQKAQLQRRTTGARMAFFAERLVGTPYVGWTLERDPNQEFCFVTLDGLDCVTFMESVLGLSRLDWSRPQPPSPSELLTAVTWTRYRGGKVDGYLSRLHYTSDWIQDNQAKGVIRDITPSLPGARKMEKSLSFMSDNAKVYRQLEANPELLVPLRQIEAQLTAMPKWYVPKEYTARAERFFRTGDIIALVDARPAMDYAHVGMIVMRRGVPHFVHASSTAKKVVIDSRLSEYLAKNDRQTGFSLVRPL